MAEKKISELATSTNVDLTDVMVINKSSGVETYTTHKIAVTDLAKSLFDTLEFDDLLTIAKTIFGSINEVATDKVSKTDYADEANAGAIKTALAEAIATNDDGVLQALVNSYETYKTSSGSSFVSKGTLDNVIDGSIRSGSYSASNIINDTRLNNTTGVEESASGIYTSAGYIEVAQGSTVRLETGIRSTSHRIIQYDENYNFVAGNIGSSTRTYIDITPNASTKYIRVSVYEGGSNVSVTQSGATLWEPNAGTYNAGLDDLFYKAGSRVTLPITQTNVSGFINIDAKAIYLSFPFSRPIFANTVEITGTVIIRGNNGVLNSGATFDLSANTVDKTITPMGVTLKINLSTAATGVDPNTPVNAMAATDLVFAFS